MARTNDATGGRERVSAMREQARLAEQRRRNLVFAGTAVTVVVLLLAGLIIAKVAGIGAKAGQTKAGASSAAQAAVLTPVTSVPSAALDTVGVGAAQNPPAKINAPALNTGGKPRVVYVGAEYCPFCAAQRWAVVVALSRFGTWSGLGTTTSASDDVFPDTASLSFHGATLTSDTVAFTGYETTDRARQPLDAPTAADEALLQTYNKAPYVSADAAGSIPFLSIGGTYVSSGASFSPQLLAGKSHKQIASALSDPTSQIAKAIDGSANAITAAICQTTAGKPDTVCGAAGVTAARVTLTSRG